MPAVKHQHELRALSHTKTVHNRVDARSPAVLFESSSLCLDGEEVKLLVVHQSGDLIVDLHFEISGANGSPYDTRGGYTRPVTTRQLYRVSTTSLKQSSRYFVMLLGDQYQEGQRIAKAHDELRSRGLEPAYASSIDLPRVEIREDAWSERVNQAQLIGNLLGILHGENVVMPTSLYSLTVITVMADRFDCCSALARWAKTRKHPWPQTYGVLTPATEEALRQKVLVSWLFEDNARFAAATRELILRGSSRWESGIDDTEIYATWWSLPAGIEAELHLRRLRILATLSSIPHAFVSLYSSRGRQCKQFYDSSAACDSYQLGEIIKFFLNKRLLSLSSPIAQTSDGLSEWHGDIESLLAIFRQCPTYQIDKNHGHCGMRTRLIPIVDFVQSMLASHIGIEMRTWKTDHVHATWESGEAPRTFTFGQELRDDRRLSMSGFMTNRQVVMQLFTARDWIWCVSEEETSKGSDSSRLGAAFGSIRGL